MFPYSLCWYWDSSGSSSSRNYLLHTLVDSNFCVIKSYQRGGVGTAAFHFNFSRSVANFNTLFDACLDPQHWCFYSFSKLHVFLFSFFFFWPIFQFPQTIMTRTCRICHQCSFLHLFSIFFPLRLLGNYLKWERRFPVWV